MKLDPRYSWFCERWPEYKDLSCELDAIPPGTLRQLVREAIEPHLPDGWMQKILFAEPQGRSMLRRMEETINQNRNGYE